jgi:UDP-N-acetyl-D-mannosaminuronic acid transferase (WecB/TagA/CpsF family)
VNFYNSQEVVNMLSAPPFAFNRVGAVQAVIEDNDKIKLVGTKQQVDEAVHSLTHPKSSHAKYFARHKTFFQAQPSIMEDKGHSAIMQIGSRRKW